MVGSIFLREKEGGKREKGKRERGEDTGYIVDIHCGVVGNIQAFHVCAPGSIPGDGIFLYFYSTAIHTHTHTYTHTCIFMSPDICVSIYMCVSVCIYIYACVFVIFSLCFSFFSFLWIPTIAQLVERRTVVVYRFP